MVEFTILRFIWSGKHFYPDVESFSCNFDSRDKKFTSYLGGDIEYVDIVEWLFLSKLCWCSLEIQ